MPRPNVDRARRTVTLETQTRKVDLEVDGAGRVLRLARLDDQAVTRGESDASPIGFRGHAALFNNRTWIGSKRYGFWEEMAPGAFSKTIGEADVRFLQNHDANYVLGRNKAGTLRLSEDGAGLLTEADMAPTTYARDLAILLERGDVSQMSFAFNMVTYEWSVADDGNDLLRHGEVALHDVSVVTYPAYADTDAGLRMDLLAAARSAGFDAVDIDRLSLRLAEPDDDVLAHLRAIARDVADITPPAAATGEPTGAPDGTRSSPAETTSAAAINALRLRTLSTATNLSRSKTR